MPFRGLKINALSRHTSMPFRGKQSLSPPHIYLCLPQCIHKITMFHNFTTRSSPHMEEVSQLQWQAQLTPSPQGFSSLPRVSEAFTPNTKIIPQSQQNQENKPNTIRSNMLIHNTKQSQHMPNATTKIPSSTLLHIHFQPSQDESKHGMKH